MSLQQLNETEREFEVVREEPPAKRRRGRPPGKSSGAKVKNATSTVKTIDGAKVKLYLSISFVTLFKSQAEQFHKTEFCCRI